MKIGIKDFAENRKHIVLLSLVHCKEAAFFVNPVPVQRESGIGSNGIGKMKEVEAVRENFIKDQSPIVGIISIKSCQYGKNQMTYMKAVFVTESVIGFIKENSMHIAQETIRIRCVLIFQNLLEMIAHKKSLMFGLEHILQRLLFFKEESGKDIIKQSLMHELHNLVIPDEDAFGNQFVDYLMPFRRQKINIDRKRLLFIKKGAEIPQEVHYFISFRRTMVQHLIP